MNEIKPKIKNVDQILNSPTFSNALNYIRILENLCLLTEQIFDNIKFGKKFQKKKADDLYIYQQEVPVLDKFIQNHMPSEQKTENMEEFKNIYRVLNKAQKICARDTVEKCN